MGILSRKDQEYTFKFLPYRISDNENPVWILTQISFLERKDRKIDETFSIALIDLDQIIQGLKNLMNREKLEFQITTMDENFILKIYANENEREKFFIEFYFGEYSKVMKGYRFSCVLEDLNQFLKELERDKQQLKPQSDIP